MSGNLLIGSTSELTGNFVGNIQDFRISKTAVYAGDFTPPVALLSCDSVGPACEDIVLHVQSDTTDGDTTFVDRSSNTHAITVFGDTQHTTTNAYLGTTSMSFDGNGDYLTIPHSSLFNFGSDDFTIEFWVNYPILPDDPDSTMPSLIGHGDGGGGQSSTQWSWFIITSSTGASLLYYTGTEGWQSIKFIHVNDGVGPTFETNRWYHLAVTRQSNTLTTYVDGIMSEQQINVNAFRDYNGSLIIGRRENEKFFNGYMQDLRISNQAIYTSNFTPPTTLLNNPC
jgi:hypothetical protein